MSAEIHRFGLRVYYEDTDFSGVVYHANYLRFLERGRTEMLRDLGIDQAALFAGEAPVAFAVARIEIDFRRPARMDDLLSVETSIVQVGGASLSIHQRLLREPDLLAEASVKVAAVSRGRAVRLPPAVMDRLGGSIRRAAATPGRPRIVSGPS